VTEDAFTTVHVTTDPVESEMLLGALRAEAIAARVVHQNGALVGAGDQIFQIRLQVASEDAGRARELLDELREPGELADATAPAPEGPEVAAPKRSALKLGVGLILPSAAHFYVGQPWTAIALEVGLLSALAAGWFTERELVGDAAFATIFAIIGADVLGGWRALRALDRGGAVPERDAQLGRGLKLFAAAMVAGVVVAAVVSIPRWRRERALAGLEVTCSDHDVHVTNHTATDRYLSIRRIAFGPYLSKAPPWDARLEAREQRRVAPGWTLAVEYRLDDDTCYRSGCALSVEVEAQDVEPAKAPILKGAVRCVPEWRSNAPPVAAPGPLRSVVDER
jgi:hypothetical protein